MQQFMSYHVDKVFLMMLKAILPLTRAVIKKECFWKFLELWQNPN